MKRTLIWAMLVSASMSGAGAKDRPPAKAERFAQCGGFLEGATFDKAGTLWAVDLFGGAIFSVGPNGQCTKRGTTGGRPNGARFHRDGRLFIADNQHGIIAIDLATMKQEVIVDNFRGERITSANDLVFDADGGLYFTDPNASTVLDRKGRVFYLPPGKDQALRLFADGLIFPNGIALSPDGQELLVGQLRDKSILSFPVVGSKAAFQGAYVYVRTSGGMGPDGMAFDAKGTLYWAQFQGRSIGIADSPGQINTSISLGEDAGTYVTNLAFHAGWIYITEAEKGEIWRYKVGIEGQKLFSDAVATPLGKIRP